MIEFYVPQAKWGQLEIRLEQSAPRMAAAIAENLQALIRAGAKASASSPYWAYGVTGKNPRIRDTGDALHTRSGDLQRSIEASPTLEQGTDYIRAVWGAATPYARIHEKGGRAGRHHATYIPARPYLLPVLEKMRDQIREAVQLGIIEALIESGLTTP